MTAHSIHATRRQNLKALIAGYPQQSDFAAAIERDEALVSRYALGATNIGSVMARHIESSLGMPSGWMDHPHPASEPGRLAAVMEAFIASNPSPKVADTIAALLEALIEDRRP